MNNLISDLLKLDLKKFRGGDDNQYSSRFGGAAQSEKPQPAPNRLKENRHSDTPGQSEQIVKQHRRVNSFSTAAGGGPPSSSTGPKASSAGQQTIVTSASEEKKGSGPPGAMHRKNVPSMEKSTRKSSQSNKSGGGTELDNTTKESSSKAAGVTTLDNSSSQVTLNEAIVTERGKRERMRMAPIRCVCLLCACRKTDKFH